MSAAEAALGKDGKYRLALSFLGFASVLSSVLEPVLVPLPVASSASIVLEY
ncbi:hypothetical protein [Nostoc sp.]|uniref:hypothetical protein n=1 Tax=Nostoc sp. TaxID=1180 RepID=UPI002FEFA7F0